MMKRTCQHCGQSMLLARADAKFCTTKCRVYASRAAKKAGSLPKEMTDLPRFVRYASTKRPLTVGGRSASSTDSATWSAHSDAVASKMGEGVGFVLGAGVGCIDLDHCIVDGELEQWAIDVLAANPNTFVEVSRSGDGLHVFGLMPEGPGRKIRDGRNIEVYSVGRYMALTGKRYNNAPLRLAPLVVPSM